MKVAEAGQYLATVLSPLMAVISSPALLGETLWLNERYRLPWYDALILAGAMEGRCSILYSEDFWHGQRFGDFHIENPFL